LDYDPKDLTFKELQNCAVVSSSAEFDVPKELLMDPEFKWYEAAVQGDATEIAIVKFF
jgi:hypothetical protein